MAYTTIKKPSDYFNTKLYEGNGSSPRSITGIGFQPDWTWTKNRDNTNGHGLFDAVRGYTTGKGLSTHNANAEGSADAYGYLSSRDSDGYTMTQGGSGMTMNNTNGESYVSWNWKANGTGVSNTDGSITSTVSANTTSGFSIVSYTGNDTDGATVGHGLTSPKLILIKARSSATPWIMYGYPNHPAFPTDGSLLQLESSNAMADSSTKEASIGASTVTFVDSGGDINASGVDFVMYCFQEKKGFSKFGSYTGNGNSDGSFIYTGFKPAWILIKHSGGGTAGGEQWNLQDVKRSTYNPSIVMLSPNTSDADNSTTNNSLDILSNGFKVRTVDNRLNNSGATYIYMAFAEEPLVGDNPATAR